MNKKEHLRYRRKELGLTMLEVANMVGVSEATVSRWENGQISSLKGDKIILLAKALEVSTTFILGEQTQFAERLYQAIRYSNISYGELAEITKIPKAILKRYATGETAECPVERIEAIAKATGVSLGYLLGLETDISSLPSPTLTEDYITFPVIGEIAAGYDKIATENWSGETIDIPTRYLKGRSKEEFFVLTISGDSMYPLYQNGDKVLVLKQTTLNRPGEIGAILYEDEKATLKRVSYVPGEDWLELIPINPEFMPQRIEGENLEHCRIIGVPRLLIREIS